MNSSTRRKLLALVVATALALVGAAAVGAAAAPPEKEVFLSSFTFDDTWSCPGITITQHNEERDTFTWFSATKLRVQRHGIATLSANGKTLTSNFSAQIFIDPTTTVEKVVGTVYNIQVPGRGNLLLDAGNVIYDYSTNPLTILHVAGPHQALMGDVGELCGYLAAS